jgi:hypothetical protein
MKSGLSIRAAAIRFTVVWPVITGKLQKNGKKTKRYRLPSA